ncbi:MAG TPA: acetylornithine deacetylase [Bryobacteraceae bacterium]|jgi:acetylornithine deacetylase|nr:acetylornithine deacetylase [Bryobacteraceae bacterium]
MKSAVDHLLELVAIPSVSSMSNRPVIDYALGQLDASVWRIKVYPYGDAAGLEKVNLVATTGPGVAELLLVCHTDTVPFDPAWPEAVHPQVRNGSLYGRGSCDVKGYLACVLAAVSGLNVHRLSKSLAILLTADEEIGCVGAKYIAGRNAIRARYAIIGEPTGLHPVRAGKGYALAEIVVGGKEAHSAFPDRGRSAIYDAARVVARLEQVAKKLAARKNADFDPPYTTLNVGLIRGGTAKNIVPGECRITVEWRPVPGDDPRRPAVLIQEELARLRHRYPGFHARIDLQRLDPAFDPSPTDDLAALVQLLARRRPATVAFGTEAAHLCTLTTETIVFGPGNMETAHRTGEFVPTAELNKCVAILKAVIEKTCGSIVG